MAEPPIRRLDLRSNGTLRRASAIIGFVLLCVGRRVLGWPGVLELSLLSLPAVAVGIGAFLLGALLIAASLPQGSALKSLVEPEPCQRDDSIVAGAMKWRWLAAVAMCVGAFLGLSATNQAGWTTALAWLLSLMAGGFHFAGLDRRSSTSFGWPVSDIREAGGLIACVALAMVVVSFDLTDWRWAGTPDEICFLDFSTRPNFELLPANWYSESGLWGYHPILSHSYQALFLKVFGPGLFGWRLSSVVALAVSLPFFYLFVRDLWGSWSAWMAIVFLASAPLVVAFAHLGYNNIQSLPLLTASLGIFSWSMRRKSALGYFLSGAIAGLGVYTFYAARVALPLVVILGFFGQGFTLRRPGRIRTFALAVGYVLAVIPWLMLTDEAIAHMREQSFLHATSGPSQMLVPILRQWGLSLLQSVSSVWGTSHFLVNPLFDPILSALTWIGIWLACLGIRDDWRGRFLLTAWLFTAFVAGGLSPYAAPPLTRLFIAVPLYAVFAATALDRMRIDWFGGGAGRPQMAALLCIVLLLGSATANIFSLQRGLRTAYHGFGDGTTSELIRTAKTWPEDTRLVFFERAGAGVTLVDYWFRAYGMADRFYYFGGRGKQYMTKPPNPADGLPTLLSIPPPFAVFSNLEDAALDQRIHEILAARFPDAGWRETDEGKPWSIRYSYVPAN